MSLESDLALINNHSHPWYKAVGRVLSYLAKRAERAERAKLEKIPIHFSSTCDLTPSHPLAPKTEVAPRITVTVPGVKVIPGFHANYAKQYVSVEDYRRAMDRVGALEAENKKLHQNLVGWQDRAIRAERAPDQIERYVMLSASSGRISGEAGRFVNADSILRVIEHARKS